MGQQRNEEKKEADQLFLDAGPLLFPSLAILFFLLLLLVGFLLGRRCLLLRLLLCRLLLGFLLRGGVGGVFFLVLYNGRLWLLGCGFLLRSLGSARRVRRGGAL
jgi:hypothetical protein